MLVLTRKAQEEILIGDSIRISIVRIKGNTVRLGIEAPRDVRVVRAELPPNDGGDGGVETTEIVFSDASGETEGDDAGEVERAPRTPAMKNPRVQAVLRSMLAGSRPA